MTVRAYTPEEGLAEARRRIAVCRQARSTELDLSGLRLTAIPDEVATLPWLTYLDLGPSSEARKQPDFRPWSATELCNAVRVFPHAIADALPHLTDLYLSFNQIGAAGAPALSGLTALTSLDLAGNEIWGWDGAELGYLRQLRAIDLSGAELTTNLAAVWRLPRLERAVLFKTVLASVPRTVLSQGEHEDCLTSLRAYFADLPADPTTSPFAVPAVKLMLLGNGAVGKTQIRRRLADQAFEKERSPTHGVEIEPMDLADAADGTQRRAVVWDFGGQDIYLGTHALFLKAAAIFVLVWSREDEDKTEHMIGSVTFENYTLPWWLNYVTTLGGDEPAVLIVENKCDEKGSGEAFPNVDLSALRKCGFVRSPLHYSARGEQAGGEPRGHDALFAAIAEAIDHVHAREGVPVIGPGWAAISDQLEAARDTGTRWIDNSTYNAWCAETGGVSDPSVLLLHLHRTGTVFADDALFEDRIIVDQDWALRAIYAVFDHENDIYQTIRDDHLGCFTQRLLAREIWDRLGYDDEAQKLILSMMRQCGVAFLRLDDDKGNAEYVAPDLLPEKTDKRIAAQLDKDWDETSQCEEATYAFDLFPPGLFRLFTARIGEEAGLGATCWRSGFFLFERETAARALVEAERDAGPDRRLGMIRLRTQPSRSGGDPVLLLERLCARLDEVVERVGTQAKVSHQPTRERRRGARGDVQHRSANGSTHVAPIRSGVDRTSDHRVYVSYAWGRDDRQLIAAVESVCSAAAAQGVEILRDVDEIAFGREIERFMDDLAEGDHVYIVLSDSYLRSSFCMYELYAMWCYARQKPSEFRDRTTVLFLPDTDIFGGGAAGNMKRAAWAAHWRAEAERMMYLSATNSTGTRHFSANAGCANSTFSKNTQRRSPTYSLRSLTRRTAARSPILPPSILLATSLRHWRSVDGPSAYFC